MYQALYRKYRPASFKEVVGQDVIVKVLENAIKNNKLTHAYLFSGPRGTGKTSIAKIFAKTINCYNIKEGVSCNECVSCTQINNKQSTDIIEIDAASNNGVDEIRELKSKVNLVPSNSKYKIYIIDEVHMLTVGAFNALLKTLEEPPPHIIFILATTEPHKIPTTILSRCQRFDFKKISENKIVERLNNIVVGEKIQIDEESLKEISRLAEGGLRDAISILDQVLSYADNKITLKDVHDVNGTLPQQELTEMIEAMIDRDINVIFNIIEKFNDDGKNLIKVSEEIILFLKNILIYKTAPSLLEPESHSLYKKIENKISEDEVLILIKEMNISINEMKNSSNPKLILELLILKIVNKGKVRTKKNEIEKVQKKDEEPKKIIQKEIVMEKENKIEKNLTNEKEEEISDISKIKKKIEKIKLIRINNAFSAISKQKLLTIKKDISDIQSLILDPDYGEVASIILDGELKACGLDYLIFVYKTERLADIFNYNLIKIEEVIHNHVKTPFRVIATHSTEWDNLRKEYKSKTKEYKYIEEDFDIKNILKKPNDKKDDIEQLFDQIIEYK
jgi:DNA polymerase-3 subunit gamma/tau